MADKTEKTPVLGQDNPKPKWLQEVERDAVRITEKRMRDEAEERERQEREGK